MDERKSGLAEPCRWWRWAKHCISITVRIRRPCGNIHYDLVTSPWLLSLRKTGTQHDSWLWTTAKLSHISVPFNCQRRITFISFMSVSRPSCLSSILFSFLCWSQLRTFNVFVLLLDPAFVLNDIYLRLVHSFSLCPSFRDRYSAKTFKYNT